MTTMPQKKRRLIRLALAVSFFIFLWGCSTSSQRPGKVTSLDLKEMGPKEMARFLKNVRSPGGNLEAHYLLACYYQERERHREAIVEFKKVLLIDPKYVKAYSGMGISYDLLKEHPHAIESYQNALELDPTLDYVENNLGYSYLLQGNQEQAISAFQRAVALNGKEKRFHNNLGLAYAMNGQLEESLEEFKLGGDASRAHFNVAQFYHKKGLYPLAQFHYSIALTLDPTFTHARLALKAVNALMRILEPEAPAIEAKEKPLSEPFAFGQMEPERSASLPSSVTSEPPPNPLRGTGTDADDQTHPEAIGLQDRVVPTESQVGTSCLHDSHLKWKHTMVLRHFRIEVSNGNGATGMARKVGDYLKTRGLEVSRLTNANHFNHRVSKIYYREGYQEAASHLADQLPALDGMEETQRFDRPDIKVKLLIGKDLVPRQSLLAKE